MVGSKVCFVLKCVVKKGPFKNARILPGKGKHSIINTYYIIVLAYYYFKAQIRPLKE